MKVTSQSNNLENRADCEIWLIFLLFIGLGIKLLSVSMLTTRKTIAYTVGYVKCCLRDGIVMIGQIKLYNVIDYEYICHRSLYFNIQYSDIGNQSHCFSM